MEHRLFEAIQNGRAPHALLLTGCDRAAAVLIARRAAALHCTGSFDFERLKNCGGYFEFGETPVKVEELRPLIDELAKRSFNTAGRAVLLRDIGSGRVALACQNMLLKTLEEPPQGTLFLFTGSMHLIFPTIRSRCAVVRLSPLSEEEIVSALTERGAAQGEAREAARVSANSLERAENLCFRPGYRELRESALKTFLAAIKGKLPFADSKQHKEDKTALDAVGLMLSFARDMLVLKETGRGGENPDFYDLLLTATKNFTSARINAIIEALTRAHRQLSAAAPPATALDGLFIELSESGAECR